VKKGICVKVKNKRRMPASTTPFNNVLELQARGKTNKKHPNWKRSRTIFADDMILYIENP